MDITCTYCKGVGSIGTPGIPCPFCQRRTIADVSAAYADTIQQQAERIRELEIALEDSTVAIGQIAYLKQQLAELKESAMLGIDHTNQYTSDLEQQLSEVVEYAGKYKQFADLLLINPELVDMHEVGKLKALPLPKAMQEQHA